MLNFTKAPKWKPDFYHQISQNIKTGSKFCNMLENKIFPGKICKRTFANLNLNLNLNFSMEEWRACKKNEIQGMQTITEQILTDLQRFFFIFMLVFVNCHLRDFILQTWQKSKKNCQNKSMANLFHQADMSLIWGTTLKQSSHNKHFLKLLIKYKSVGWTVNSIRIIYNDRIISPSQKHCTKMEDMSH